MSLTDQISILSSKSFSPNVSEEPGDEPGEATEQVTALRGRT